MQRRPIAAVFSGPLTTRAPAAGAPASAPAAAPPAAAPPATPANRPAPEPQGEVLNPMLRPETAHFTDGGGAGVVNLFTQDYWWPKGISGLYRPLTSFSYWLNWTALGSGHSVKGFHYVNFAIHYANAFLVYVLMLKLYRRFWVAFFTAALFAVHPVAVESVTNIIGRADLLAAFCVLAGLLVYMRSTYE